MGNENLALTAQDVMQVAVKTVPPTMPLPELERELLSAKVGGFPVIESGRRLVGIISRSDVVRALCKERRMAGKTSDFYFDATGFHEIPMESLKDIADRVGERLEGMLVKDAMVENPRTVPMTLPINQVAYEFVEHHIHRLPVVDGQTLVGIISTLDLVRLISQHRLTLRGSSPDE